jgi:hypothetical protein
VDNPFELTENEDVLTATKEITTSSRIKVVVDLGMGSWDCDGKGNSVII